MTKPLVIKKSRLLQLKRLEIKRAEKCDLLDAKEISRNGCSDYYDRGREHWSNVSLLDSLMNECTRLSYSVDIFDCPDCGTKEMLCGHRGEKGCCTLRKLDVETLHPC